ncbi:MAG: RNA polymerase sigma-70 factor (ECF subfamily) [Salibacteraceae bacterium]
MGKLEHRKLLKACLSGKNEAFKEMYDIFSQDMFKVCCMYAPDTDTANDFLQDGFIKVFQNLHKYQPSGSLGGWIRRVIVNSCIDNIRRDHWSKIMTSFEEQEIDITEIYNDSDFENELNSRTFFEITNELPVGYRTILNLYFLEEYTHKEISELLGISVGTSKSQLFKAKRYLKEVLLKSLTLEEIEFYVGRLVKEVV